MKKIILTNLILIFLSQVSSASPDSVKFAVIRLDYLTYSLKHIYFFKQPYQLSIPAEHETIYHDLYVRIIPAGDFGSTTIRSANTGKIIYEATTVWDGTGVHQFPTIHEEISKPDTAISPIPEFMDIENYFFSPNDSSRADTAWQTVSNFSPLQLFAGDKYGAFNYLHYFSVGLSDPRTAEWIIIYYSIPEAVIGNWVSIAGDLPNLHINTIATHPFHPNSLFVGTDAGAFETADRGKHWIQMKFGENPDVCITQIRAERHPYLDWTVPVLWLGTEEYTLIPEDRLGRIFFSVNGGMEWRNAYFRRIAVSALEVPYDSSLVAFAGAYNPFYNQDGFFASDDTGWVKYDLTPGDTTAIRINCIEVDEQNPHRIFLGTSDGLYYSKDGGRNWERRSSHHPVPAVVIWQYDPSIVYAILLHGTRSEGIYRSEDDGQSWGRVCWTVNAVTLLPDKDFPQCWYLAVKNIGIFKSIDGCSTWIDITDGLTERDILCLAQNRQDRRILYAGTTNGIFRYEEIMTNVAPSFNNPEQTVPQKIELYPAYPNPFNAVTFIRFALKEKQFIRLEIYNLTGQLVRNVIGGEKAAGLYTMMWDGKDNSGQPVASGIYIYMLSNLKDRQISSRKIILLK